MAASSEQGFMAKLNGRWHERALWIYLVIVILANGLLQNIVQPIAMGATLRMNPLLILVVTISAGAFSASTNSLPLQSWAHSQPAITKPPGLSPSSS